MNNSQKNTSKISKLFSSIDNFLIEGKEQKLKAKLGNKIKNSIFTDEILKKLNEHDFTGIAGEEEDIVILFSTIFPIFIKENGIVFRLYKHKIEVDLSDEMRDRYIYMFSDGRLTSGLFKCFNISDDEYVYGIKRIIDVIPLFKTAILDTLLNYGSIINSNNKMEDFKSKESVAENNYDELVSYLTKEENK
ncbi:hypothetical protein [Clostridium sp.]|uniref:hypothetical protein n=1 Tax=Clostridium sp. TaxID=1506 RepID=UPI0025C254EE|nr:hypothetical protein [Clostridium sp.]